MSPLFLGLTFVLLNTLDVGLTFLGLQAGLREANPLLLAIGWPTTVAVKAAVSVGIGAMAYWEEAQPAVKICICGMVMVCIWNAVMVMLAWQT